MTHGEHRQTTGEIAVKTIQCRETVAGHQPLIQLPCSPVEHFQPLLQSHRLAIMLADQGVQVTLVKKTGELLLQLDFR